MHGCVLAVGGIFLVVNFKFWNLQEVHLQLKSINWSSWKKA
jgi:hypothetical protein